MTKKKKTTKSKWNGSNMELRRDIIRPLQKKESLLHDLCIWVCVCVLSFWSYSSLNFFYSINQFMYSFKEGIKLNVRFVCAAHNTDACVELFNSFMLKWQVKKLKKMVFYSICMILWRNLIWGERKKLNKRIKRISKDKSIHSKKQINEPWWASKFSLESDKDVIFSGVNTLCIHIIRNETIIYGLPILSSKMQTRW